MAVSVLGLYGASMMYFNESWHVTLWKQRYHIAISIGYVVLYVAMQRGMRDSALYLDPLDPSLAYWAQLPKRILFLCSELWFQLPSDIAFLGKPYEMVLWFSGVLSIFVSRVLFQKKDVWLWFATILCLIPLCAAPPTGRMLLIAILPFSIVLGAMLDRIQYGRSVLILSCGLSMLISTGMKYGQEKTEEQARLIALEVNLCGSDVPWILNAPDHIVGFYLPFYREMVHQKSFIPIRTVSMQHDAMRFRRVSQGIEMESTESYLTGIVEGSWNAQYASDYRWKNFWLLKNRIFAPIPQDDCILVWNDGHLRRVEAEGIWRDIPGSLGPSGL